MRLAHALCVAAATLGLARVAHGQEPAALPVIEPVAKPAVEPPPLNLPAIPATACPLLGVPEFIGDQTPIMSFRSLPSGQVQGTGVLYVPSVRYFKISDNDSPRPQTRTYFSFNYFYNL